MVPKRALLSFDALPTDAGRGVFVELGCGDGSAVIAAAKVFGEAHGFDERNWLLRLARRNGANVTNAKFHAWNEREKLLPLADCVLLSLNGQEDHVRILMKSGAYLLRQAGDDQGSALVSERV